MMIIYAIRFEGTYALPSMKCLLSIYSNFWRVFLRYWSVKRLIHKPRVKAKLVSPIFENIQDQNKSTDIMSKNYPDNEQKFAVEWAIFWDCRTKCIHISRTEVQTSETFYPKVLKSQKVLENWCTNKNQTKAKGVTAFSRKYIETKFLFFYTMLELFLVLVNIW